MAVKKCPYNPLNPYNEVSLIFACMPELTSRYQTGHKTYSTATTSGAHSRSPNSHTIYKHGWDYDTVHSPFSICTFYQNGGHSTRIGACIMSIILAIKCLYLYFDQGYNAYHTVFLFSPDHIPLRGGYFFAKEIRHVQ